MFSDIIYDEDAIEKELDRLLLYCGNKFSLRELRKIASRRVRYAVRDALNGFRPRLKGYEKEELGV